MDTRILNPEQLDEIAELLEADQVVALPTETVYGLAGRAGSRTAVERIFAVKERPADNPLIVHAGTRDAALALGRSVPGYAGVLAREFWPGPLSLVLESAVAWPWVQGGHDTVAVRVPRPAWLRHLLERVGPLAAPSANRSGRPSPTEAAHCLVDLEGRVAAVVDGGRCAGGLESTVVDCTGPEPVVLRPGPVTEEMIAAALAGSTGADPGGERRSARGAPGLPGTTSPDPARRAASPGTRHPHYRPRARVILVEDAGAVTCTDCMVIGPAPDAGKPDAGAADLPEDAREAVHRRRWTSREELARNLYAWFREADREGVPVIYVERVTRDGLGAALMNRLEKAAEG